MLNSFFLTSFIVFLDKQIKFTSFFVNQIISEYTQLHKVEWIYHLSNNINLPSTTKCFMSNKNLMVYAWVATNKGDGLTEPEV